MDKKWGVYNENGLINTFSTKEEADKEVEKLNFRFQTCGFFVKSDKSIEEGV